MTKKSVVCFEIEVLDYFFRIQNYTTQDFRINLEVFICLSNSKL